MVLWPACSSRAPVAIPGHAPIDRLQPERQKPKELPLQPVPAYEDSSSSGMSDQQTEQERNLNLLDIVTIKPRTASRRWDN